MKTVPTFWLAITDLGIYFKRHSQQYMYITAASISASKKVCTLFKCHLNKSRYIHITECYTAECSNFASLMWKDVTNTLLSKQQFLTGYIPQLACDSSVSRVPRSEQWQGQNGTTLNVHPIHTSLFKLLARNMFFFFLCNDTFSKAIGIRCSLSNTATDKWLNTYGMALISPLKSHQRTNSERAPAGLQKCAQACLHAWLVTSTVPVPTTDRVRLAMQPQPSENALWCHSQCFSMWGTIDGLLEPSRGVTAHDANTWLQSHVFFMWIPTCKVTREASSP